MYEYLGIEDGSYKVSTPSGVVFLDEVGLRTCLLQHSNTKGIRFDDNGNILLDNGEFLIQSSIKAESRNSNMLKAKKEKNDEFYTQLSDIEKELSNYPVETFKDKVIYCPMDVATNTGKILQSQFVKYFQLNAHRLQFKRLITTCLYDKADGGGSEVQNCYILDRKEVSSAQQNL